MSGPFSFSMLNPLQFANATQPPLIAVPDGDILGRTGKNEISGSGGLTHQLFYIAAKYLGQATVTTESRGENLSSYLASLTKNL